jgi:hypothetical protein
MTPRPVERGDARLEHQHCALEDVADERWEDEGGAIAPNLTTLRSVPVPRSHHFGEGQIGRTITQDEQDRLAGRS